MIAEIYKNGALIDRHKVTSQGHASEVFDVYVLDKNGHQKQKAMAEYYDSPDNTSWTVTKGDYSMLVIDSSKLHEGRVNARGLSRK